MAIFNSYVKLPEGKHNIEVGFPIKHNKLQNTIDWSKRWHRNRPAPGSRATISGEPKTAESDSPESLDFWDDPMFPSPTGNDPISVSSEIPILI